MRRHARGLKAPTRAAEAFVWAVDETTRRYGSYDVAWGDVHRVRLGKVDVPVGGCSGALGCFRVLNFRTDPDGKRSVVGGDGWVLAVEFGDVPRAYSVLAYGESRRADSPFHHDQAAMFGGGGARLGGRWGAAASCRPIWLVLVSPRLSPLTPRMFAGPFLPGLITMPWPALLVFVALLVAPLSASPQAVVALRGATVHTAVG